MELEHLILKHVEEQTRLLTEIHHSLLRIEKNSLATGRASRQLADQFNRVTAGVSALATEVV